MLKKETIWCWRNRPQCQDWLPGWPFANLAVQVLGWPFGFFWLFFEGRLAENLFCWLFLKIGLYFKAKLSMTTPFLKVSFPVCAFRLDWVVNYKWNRGSVSVRLCLPRCADLALCWPSRCAYTCLWVLYSGVTMCADDFHINADIFLSRQLTITKIISYD